METESEISHPKISHQNHFPLWYQAYLRFICTTFRTLLPWTRKDPGLFDFEEKVPTPGLGNGECLVRVFLPLDTAVALASPTPETVKKIPLIIHLEGGGFVMGTPAGSSFNLRFLADHVKSAVVSVDYAKSPTYPYPHALLQIPHVIGWACKRLPLSPSQVAIGGNSAGGNLSASFSLLSSFKSLPDSTDHPRSSSLKSLPDDFALKTQFLVVPSVHQDASYDVRLEASKTEECKKNSLPRWIACPMEDAYLPPPISRTSPFVAPAMISDKILKFLVDDKAFPQRALVITAALDCLNIEGGKFAEKLKRAGVKVEEKEFQGATHHFDHAAGWDGKKEGGESVMAMEALNMIADHLNDVFKQG